MGVKKIIEFKAAAIGLAQVLERRPSQNKQRKHGSKRNWNHFTIVKLFRDAGVTVIKGMMSGPKFSDLRFSVTFDGAYKVEVSPGGRSVAQAIEIVKEEVVLLYKSTLSERSGFEMSRKKWDGHYMQARKAGPAGIATFESVVEQSLVSKEFAAQAIEWGFTIQECHPAP